jgi:hypothetical protein
VDETLAPVIETVRQNRARFEEFCRSLDEAQLQRLVPDSSWVVRDFVAHLGTLDVVMTRWLEDVASGAEAALGGAPDGARWDVDAFNDAQVLARRSWPLDQVLAEAEQNRTKLIAAIQSLSGPQVDLVMHFSGDSKRPGGDIALRWFLTGWAQHDPIHVADMLRALPEFAGDAALRAWVDNPIVHAYQRAMNPESRQQSR